MERAQPTQEEIARFMATMKTCDVCVRQGFGWDEATQSCGLDFPVHECPAKEAAKPAPMFGAEAAPARRRDDDDEEDEELSKLRRKMVDDEDDEEDEGDDEPSGHSAGGYGQGQGDVEIEPQQAPKLELDDRWANTEITTSVWQAISSGNEKHFMSMLQQEPRIAIIRSEDGRGPLFWAYEFGRKGLIDALISAGANPEAKDTNGQTPQDLGA